MLSPSVDSYGGHGTEPMMMGSPGSPVSPMTGHSQYLPGYLLGDSTPHMPSPGSRLWTTTGTSPPKSASRPGTITSSSGLGMGTSPGPRNDLLRPKEKLGAPPVKGLLDDTASKILPQSPYATAHQLSHRGAHTPGSLTSTPAPGLSHSLMEPSGGTAPFDLSQSLIGGQKLPTSPSQLDPFYTQGEALSSDDVLDETWITVFGFPPAAASYIIQQFSQYGNILKHVVASEGNWMHLHYQSKLQAKKALSKNGKVFGGSIMIGVLPCIDKSIMSDEKENYNISQMMASGTPGNLSLQNSMTASGSTRNTPIRPLTAAYKAAKNENEVVRNNHAPQKSNSVVTKVMEYVFNW